MTKDVIRVDGIEDGIDFDERYQVKGQSGIVYYLLGWEAEQRPMICLSEVCGECGESLYDCETSDSEHDYDPKEFEYEDWSETELVRAGDNVIAVMVGDDHRWAIDKDDLILIADEDYCHECGQIGCCANVYASA